MNIRKEAAPEGTATADVFTLPDMADISELGHPRALADLGQINGDFLAVLATTNDTLGRGGAA